MIHAAQEYLIKRIGDSYVHRVIDNNMKIWVQGLPRGFENWSEPGI